MSKYTSYYIVSAGNYEGNGDENCKFSSAPINDVYKAVAALKEMGGYPWSRAEVYNREGEHLATIT